MRKQLIVITISLFFVSLFNKLGAQTYNPFQIAVINSQYFEDEKTGIKKYTDVQKKVQAEFRPRIDEITAMQKKLDDLKRVLESTSAKIDQSKIDEYELLNKSKIRKAEDYQVQINKRYNELLQPVNVSIGMAMKQWCKQKGYDMLLDISKDDKGIILWVKEDKINELTLDLIKHINTLL